MDTPIKEKLGQTMDGKCVLVTGVTGFVGKVIMEKLLYEFPNIKRIYVMIRGKKANPPRTPRGLSATERFQADVLASEIWGIRMRKAGEDDETFKARIMAKVKAIEGSLGGERCSISAHDWKTLCRELDTIIHCAASVNFNDHLQEQVKTNVTGASELIKLLEGPKVKAGQEDGANATPRTFVHVSTCYVGFPKGASNKAIKAGADGRVEEGPCVFPYDPEELLRELLDSPREAVSERQKRLLSDAGHRNTYTFSKAMAETLLTARCNANPGSYPKLVIVRPSCVGAAASEPCCGWIDAATANGAMYLFCMLGYLKYFPGGRTLLSDQIPVDYVSNACIIASAFAPFDDRRIRQVHVGSSDSTNPLTWGESGSWVCWSYAILNYQANPKKLQMKNPSGWYFLNTRALFSAYYALSVQLPARLAAPLKLVGGGKVAAMLAKLERRVGEFVQLFGPFTTRQWIFECSYLPRLQQSQGAWLNGTPTASRRFETSCDHLNWAYYLHNMARGMQRFCLKPPPKDLSGWEATTLDKMEKPYNRSNLLSTKRVLLQGAAMAVLGRVAWLCAPSAMPGRRLTSSLCWAGMYLWKVLAYPVLQKQAALCLMSSADSFFDGRGHHTHKTRAWLGIFVDGANKVVSVAMVAWLLRLVGTVLRHRRMMQV